MNVLGILIFILFLVGMLALLFVCMALFVEALNDTELGRAIIRRFKRGD